MIYSSPDLPIGRATDEREFYLDCDVVDRACDASERPAHLSPWAMQELPYGSPLVQCGPFVSAAPPLRQVLINVDASIIGGGLM